MVGSLLVFGEFVSGWLGSLLVVGWFVGDWLAGDWLAGSWLVFFYTGSHSVVQAGIELTGVPFCSLLSNWRYKHQTVHQGSCLFYGQNLTMQPILTSKFAVLLSQTSQF